MKLARGLCSSKHAVARDLGHSKKEKLNIAGGAISLGHPLGATGTRLVMSAVNSLRKINGRRAIVSLCIGGESHMKLEESSKKKFYQWLPEEKSLLTEKGIKLSEIESETLERLDKLSENVIGQVRLPLRCCFPS